MVSMVALRLFLLTLLFSPIRTEGDALHRVALANAVADATDDPEEQTALVRIAWYESALRSDVATCRTLGDGGKSKGLFQVQPQSARDAKLACGSIPEQVEVALRYVRRSAEACPGFEGADKLSLYVSGKCVRGMAQAKHRWGGFDRLMRPVPALSDKSN